MRSIRQKRAARGRREGEAPAAGDRAGEPQGLRSSAGLPSQRLGTAGGRVSPCGRSPGPLHTRGSTSPHGREGRSPPPFPRSPLSILKPGRSPGRDRWSSTAAREGLWVSSPLLFRAEDTSGALVRVTAPQDVPGGTEGLHGAWGWAEGCLEVTGIGPSGGTVLEELGLSSGLGSLCFVYLFIQKGLELGGA